MDFITNFTKSMTFKDWLLVIMAFLLCLTFFSMRHYMNESYNRAVIAERALYEYKNKVDQEYIARDVYIQTKKELEKYNKELAEEIKNLKDNPIVVTKVVTKTVIKEVPAESDSVTHHNDSVNNERWTDLHWSAREKDGHYTIVGSTSVKAGVTFSSGAPTLRNGSTVTVTDFKTKLTEVSIPAKLTLNVIEDTKAKQLRFIGRSDNPYVTISDLDGVVVDPKKSKMLKSCFPQKRVCIGPYVGYGIGTDLKLSPQIGIGVSYMLLGF